MRPGEGFDRVGQLGISGDRPVMLPVGAHQIRQHLGVAGVAFRTRGDMPFAVTRRRQRVDREHPIAGRQQGLHPRAAVGLNADHHGLRLVVAEVIGDQRMQRGHPRDAFRQTLTGQPAPLGILQLDVVMGFGPVITDEQHRDRFLLVTQP
jgi:hypothetical protein